jgi:AraC family transcriptional regulator, dual regulator of chb operon
MSSVDVPKVLRLQDFVRAPAACHVASRLQGAAGLPPLHSHDFLEIFWISKGRLLHTIGDEIRPLEAGHLFWVAADDVHGFRTRDDKGYHITNVAFARSHWSQLMQRYDLQLDLFAQPVGRREVHLGKLVLANLQQHAAELLAGGRDKKALDRFLLNLLHLLTQHPSTESASHPPPWLRHALEKMRTPAHLESGTEAFVALCGRSPEHLARECRRWLGKTPTVLVTELRLDRAAVLLAETETPVLELALGLGYSNISHFYRLFLARFATTPAQYRASQRNEQARIFGATVS